MNNFTGTQQQSTKLNGILDGIIFDLDGTLLDTLDDLTVSLNKGLTQAGFSPLSVAGVRKRVGNGMTKLVEDACPRSTAPATLAHVEKIFLDAYEKSGYPHTHPYPGISRLVEHLHGKKIPLAVVSNKPHEAANALVQREFGTAFAVVLGQSNSYPRKPSPELCQLAIQKMGLAKKEDISHVVYVGDSEVDVQTARNARLSLYAVGWGFRSEEELRHAGASAVYKTVEELSQALMG